MNKTPIRVNLVDAPSWTRWEPAGVMGEHAQDQAWEIFVALIVQGHCDGLIMDLAGPLSASRRSKQDWSGRTISWDDAEKICVALMGQPPELALTRDVIMTALVDAYEEALTPGDRDILDAVDDTIEKMADNYDLDEEFWAPLLDQGASPDDVIRSLFEERAGGVFVDRQVSYEHKPGSSDRSLVFDFWKSGAVKAFLKALPEDWDMKTALRALEGEFRVLVSAFMSRFFAILEKEMNGIDVENRLEWKRLWKDIISGARSPGGGGYVVGHEPSLDKIRAEMLRFLDLASEPSTEENDDLEEPEP